MQTCRLDEEMYRSIPLHAVSRDLTYIDEVHHLTYEYIDKVYAMRAAVAFAAGP